MERYVVVDPKLLRPAEVDALVGDASKACIRLEWQPAVSFRDMFHIVVDQDLKRLVHVANAAH
jgi:GDPmannose 4,6-dehydratase